MKLETSMINEKFEFTDASGNVVKEIPFSIDCRKIYNDVQRKKIELSTALNDEETLGRLFVDLMRIIFGDDVLNALLEHFGEDYVTMMFDVVPILNNVVYPTMESVNRRDLEQRKKVKA